MAKDKKLFEEDAIFNMAISTSKDAARKTARSFRRSTKTWKNKPTFRIRKIPGEVDWEVYTENKVWHWLDKGTKKHEIAPKGKANGGSDRLAYQTKFTPKTSPNRVGSKPGGKSGNYWIGKKGQSVMHPGVKARKWTERQAEKEEKRFFDSFLKGLDRILNG